MTKRLLEDRARILDLFEVVGILAILALIFSQTAILSNPSLLAGAGALYIALLGAGRRLMRQRRREEEQEEEHERSLRRREKKGIEMALSGGMKPHSDESDSRTTIYNVYGDHAYIDARPESRESDRALDHTPVEERAARNRHLDEFERELDESHRQEEEDETTESDTVRFVREEESGDEREREFELERE